MKGKMGGRIYYSALMPMKAIPQFFKFTDWEGFTPEDRAQRILEDKRIPALTRYIVDNDDAYIFSSITASYKGIPEFEPNKTGDNDSSTDIGILKIMAGDELIINDGQHRCAGIVKALEENPAIGNDSISVILFPYENHERMQQMFSDLNRFVKKTAKSLDILFDKRDVIAAATVAAMDELPVFSNLVDKENNMLRVKSTKLFTLSAYYDANRDLLKGREKEKVVANAAFLADYWAEVIKHMPDWTAVLGRHKEARELRAETISSHSTVLRSLGGLGLELMKNDDWRERLSRLENINWSKKNSEWENICIVANSVVSNRQARAATKSYIKNNLGMKLTDAEQRSLEK